MLCLRDRDTDWDMDMGKDKDKDKDRHRLVHRQYGQGYRKRHGPGHFQCGKKNSLTIESEHKNGFQACI
jgi:hypothetical protein